MANTYNSNQLSKSDPIQSSNLPKNIRFFIYIAQDKLGLPAVKCLVRSDSPNKSDESYIQDSLIFNRSLQIQVRTSLTNGSF